MDPKQVQALWTELDQLIQNTQDVNTQNLLRAIKLQMQLLNGRLAGVEHAVAALSRQQGGSVYKA